MKWITGLFSGASRVETTRGFARMLAQTPSSFNYWQVLHRHRQVLIATGGYYIAASGSLPDQSWPQ